MSTWQTMNDADSRDHNKKMTIESDSKGIMLISEVCGASKKSLSERKMFLRIQNLKRRAFRLRKLIDSSDDVDERKRAIREYVRLIGQITSNN